MKILTKHNRFIAIATAIGLVGSAAIAQTQCDGIFAGFKSECRSNGLAVRTPIGGNTEESITAPGGSFDGIGFSISIDNQTIGGAPIQPDPQRIADLRAGLLDVDVRFDGLNTDRALNVATNDLRTAYRPGETVTFRASSNYPAFIERAEVRVRDMSQPGRPVVAILPVRPNGAVNWQMPADGSSKYDFALRVIAPSGRYDQTHARSLQRSEGQLRPAQTTAPIVAAGEGENSIAIRNIRIAGGLVTVFGSNVGPLQTVTVMGEAVPVDQQNRFVVSRILPSGRHTIDVRNGKGAAIERDVLIPRSEWFRLGIIDITAGYRIQDDLLSADPDYERGYVNGRAGFFVSGKTNRGYEVTASADTGDGPIEDMFQRLDGKDPRRVIDRINAASPSGTFGDDSEIYDAAPTSGRVYVKVEKEGSHILWGDFKTVINDSYFLGNNRTLYGAEARYVSPNQTSNGAPRVAATVHAAQPDTLPQREIFRATGGSVYFLKRKDINAGSEAIYVEIVDPTTKRVVSNTQLTPETDYLIDYFQGVVTLSTPLASSVGGTYDQNVIVVYEYTPTAESLDGASTGGRIEVRPSDKLTLGLTAAQENTGAADQTALAGDIRVDFGETGYIRAEVASSSGPGFGRFVSSDGGLSSTEITAAGGEGTATRVDASASLQDLGFSGEGQLGFHYEELTTGFSTLQYDITEDQRTVGLSGEFAVSERTTIGFSAEDFETETGTHALESEVSAEHQINEKLSVGLAFTNLDKTTPGTPLETGTRTDARLSFDFAADEDRRYFGFVQQTIGRTGGLVNNHRVGVGTEYQITEKLALAAEVSDGSAGAGGNVMLTHRAHAGQEIYFGYNLEPNRSAEGYDLVGSDGGTFVFGGRFEANDQLSTFTENRADLFGERRTLTSAYGVNYTPSDRWNLSGSAEFGVVRDSINGDFERQSISFGATHAQTNSGTRARFEFGTEDGVGATQDRRTLALSAGHNRKTNENWRLLLNLDALISDNEVGSLNDGEYVEGQIAYAYRPVDGSRLNLIASYIFLLDQPGADQVTVSGSTDGPKQRTNIFEIDASYAVSPKFTLGAKYGLRHSEVAPRGTNTYSSSIAHLGVLRADWHAVHQWDIGGEVRVLQDTGASATQTGASIGVYRHFGNNAKVGLGYEWGSVSDDLTDIEYIGQGVFLNLVAKL